MASMDPTVTEWMPFVKALPASKEKAKAVAAGMTDFKDAAAKEAKCKTCHNEKSPTAKKFDFAAAWKEIAHMRPK